MFIQVVIKSVQMAEICEAQRLTDFPAAQRLTHWGENGVCDNAPDSLTPQVNDF